MPCSAPDGFADKFKTYLTSFAQANTILFAYF